MDAFKNIFEELELKNTNGLFIFSENKWKGKGLFPQKVEYALKQIKPFAFFVFNKEPLLLFFEVSNKKNEDKIHEQCWNFNKAPIIFINNRSGLTIYNGFSFDESINRLKVLPNANEIKKFNYWNIVTGKLWEEYQSVLKKENRVDYKLLKNIEATRNILINDKQLDKKITNKLIGRLIFTRYLIDRRVEIRQPKEFKQKLSKETLPNLILDKKLLYDFFEILKGDFHGDLFPLEEKGKKEKNYVDEKKHLPILAHLFRGHQIYKKQLSLFNIYDFDIIPVELVSNIYEYFMGSSKQKNDKAFYTPPFLVDYILNQTIVPYFKNNQTTSCRTLDPACGSGIFLVETLRLIVANFKKYNPDIDQSSDEYKNAITQLLIDNIFGIDKNKEAIEIAVFSLYITLLDFFEEPKNIKSFKFPPLFETNFFEADFFDEGHQFNTILKDKSPHFILGNPPWGDIKNSPYKQYIKKRTEKEGIKGNIYNEQIAQAFMVRVSDFCATSTKCSLIVTSKILYNHRVNKFRAYFLDKFKLKEVLEISPVRKLIFAKAVGPAAILTYEFAHGKDTDDNFIEHIALKPNPFFALFRSILIEKYDYKEIKQSYLKEYDWIWKVLVYGSILDFYFLRRLRNRKIYPKQLKDVLDEENAVFGKGITIGNRKNDASHLLGKHYIEVNKTKDRKKSDLQRYFINYRTNNFFKEPKVERPRNPKLFEKPILLIKGGLNTNFSTVISIANQDAVFKNSVFAIRIENINLLKNLLGIFTSKLVTYFVFETGSYTGIEREQLLGEEIFPFPIISSSKIIEITQNLLNLHTQKYNNINDAHYDPLIEKAENSLNECIYELYQLTERDKHLLDYAFNISIPVFRQGFSTEKNFPPYKSLKIRSKELKLYTQILLDYYSKRIKEQTGKFLQATIYRNSAVVAINFEMLDEQLSDPIIWKKEGQEYLDFLATTAFQKLSSRLFIQKDVKGIRPNSFYVLKPNQYKLWHPAIAHLDILELDNKMINLQIKHYQQDGR